ncbi:protein of unknown function [Candidatus Nitrotoga arctica]|uniref:Uncharacterized protein n=1 Tax=Candidatus Nitrotoga arctica TaxID=453162 RepID=A0ABM8YX25_9PROT|nr:protein of unknown function [Candidatus Nitrotoga arctica]
MFIEDNLVDRRPWIDGVGPAIEVILMDAKADGPARFRKPCGNPNYVFVMIWSQIFHSQFECCVLRLIMMLCHF